jgi:hypothetical protein
LIPTPLSRGLNFEERLREIHDEDLDKIIESDKQ